MPLQHNAREENPDHLTMTEGARYSRVIGASLARVWENVHDWEHLPHLHNSSFSHIELQASGPWGWRALLKDPSGNPMVVELVTDKQRSRYVSRTIEGALPGMEIWTDLKPRGDRTTEILVRFMVPHLPEDQALKVGEAVRRTYVTLWDEDEAMMQARQRALDSEAETSADTLTLGNLSDVRQRLPLTVPFAGQPVVIFADGDVLRAFVARCPHMLRPLDDCAVDDGVITCPWHGYRFDVVSGKSCDGQRLRLITPPRLDVDEKGNVTLTAGVKTA